MAQPDQAATVEDVLVVTSSHRGFDYLAMARDLRNEVPSLTQLVVVRPGDEQLADGEVALSDLEAGDALPTDSELGPTPSADSGHLIGFTSGTEAGAKGCYHTWNTYAHTHALNSPEDTI